MGVFLLQQTEEQLKAAAEKQIPPSASKEQFSECAPPILSSLHSDTLTRIHWHPCNSPSQSPLPPPLAVEAISKSVDPEDSVDDYVKVFKSHSARLQNAAKVCVRFSYFRDS